MEQLLTLAVVTLRFDPESPEALERILASWQPYIAGPPVDKLGNMLYRFQEDQETCAAVNQAFVQLRTNLDSPAPVFTTLISPFLLETPQQAQLRTLALSGELSAVVDLRDSQPASVGEYLRALAQPVSTHLLAKHEEEPPPYDVDAAGIRLYLRSHETDSLYTLDVSPHMIDPMYQLYVRLKSRRDGRVTLTSFQTATKSDLDIFKSILNRLPDLALRGIDAATAIAE